MPLSKKLVIIGIFCGAVLLFVGAFLFYHYRYYFGPGFLFQIVQPPTPKMLQALQPPPPTDLPPSPFALYDQQRQNFSKSILASPGGSVVSISPSDDARDASFQFSAAKKLLAGKNGELGLGLWQGSGSFLFNRYSTSTDSIFDDFEEYQYNLTTGVIQTTGKGSKNWKDWGNSPTSSDGKFSVSVVAGDPKITDASNNLGTVSIKNLETGQIKILGKRIHPTGVDGSWVESSYSNPAWSPNGKFIAFYDSKHWNQDGAGVSVIKSDAKSLSEMVFLGRTAFLETERPPWGTHFWWSPDSTKFFAGDGNVVFSVEPELKEIYRPTAKEETQYTHWRWSPDSKKILVSGRSSSWFYILNVQSKTKRGFLLPADIRQSYGSGGDADWASNSRDVVLVSNSSPYQYERDQALYVINTETGKDVQITAAMGDYKNPRWSPDGEKIVYQKDGEIWMIQVTHR